ncbi:MAG TPA: alpha/beta fold hydrolase [Methylophilaceae bacterium]|nr:alpha/beta fold hydrolase [Methylophilaceae bacterium]
MQPLETLEISTRNRVNASVILMHGLGADGHDFASLAEELQLPNLRFIFPHAAHRPVTINGGYEMRAWYDLFGLQSDSPQDEAGIRQTQVQIEALITREEQRGIAAERIILAGFSQGGAIALHTAVRYPKRLAGVLALSTYLPLKILLENETHPANRRLLPIFMAHGTFDSIITLEIAKASADVLAQKGYPVDWHEYPMAHSVCAQELADMRRFICRVLTLDNGHD